MYTKLEEMIVIEKIFKKYALEKKQEFESRVSRLREKLLSFPTDIDMVSENSDITSLQFDTGALSSTQLDYVNAKNIVSKVDSMIQSYRDIYEKNQLDNNLSADEVIKEINKKFNNLKEKNFGFRKILGEVSMILYNSNDIHLNGLTDDIDSKKKSLEDEYSQGLISKEQLIYYEIMCKSLVENPNYFIQLKQRNDVHVPKF